MPEAVDTALATPPHDAAAFRAYLRRRAADPSFADKDADGVFEAFIALCEDFAALRYEAENRHRQRPFRAKTKDGALPIEWRAVEDVLTKKHGEPPVSTITRISQDHRPLVDSVLANLRKILRRTRMQVPVARVRQMDSECLRRFSMLPGATAEEKAASRRTILGVERVESFDTLENRVVKAFLVRCEREAHRYLRKYRTPATESSARILAVQRLEASFHEELRNPVWATVRNLAELPQPNYVLRQDPRYSKLWGLYKELVDQDRAMERAWPHRAATFAEAAHLWLRLSIFGEGGALGVSGRFLPRFGGESWIRRNPAEGRYLEGASPLQLGTRKTAAGDESLSFRETKNGDLLLTISRQSSDWLPSSSLIGIAFSGRSPGARPNSANLFRLVRDESLESGMKRDGNDFRVGNGSGIASAMELAAETLAAEIAGNGELP